MLERSNIKKITYNKSGSGSKTPRVSIPIKWLRQIGITEENNKCILEFDGESIKIVTPEKASETKVVSREYLEFLEAKAKLKKKRNINIDEIEDDRKISKDKFNLTYSYGDDEYIYTRGFISKSSMEAYIRIGKEKDLRVKNIEKLD